MNTWFSYQIWLWSEYQMITYYLYLGVPFLVYIYFLCMRKIYAIISYHIIHEKEGSNICLGSFITWCKPDCDELFSVALPSIVVMPFLDQLLDFVLKLPRTTTEKGLFCTANSRFSSRFSLKDSNRSCDWLGDLYNAVTLYSSNCIHLFK